MMKKILLLGFIIATISSSSLWAQESSLIKWHSIQEAIELNKTAPKKIFIDVYTDWCHYCKMMDQNTFTDSSIANYINKHFYAVKFNAEGKDPVVFSGKTFENKNSGTRSPHEFAIALLQGQLSYPSSAYLNEQSQLLTAVPGYETPAQLAPILVYFGEDYYKKQNFQDFMITTSVVFHFLFNDVALGLAIGLFIGFIAWILQISTKQERPRVSSLILVFIVVIFFWMSFHQNGLTLTFFARDYTVKTVDAFTNVFFNLESILSFIGTIGGLFLLVTKRRVTEKIIGAGMFLGLGALTYYFISGYSSINPISPEVFQSFNPLFIVALTFPVMGLFAWQWVFRNRVLR